jgi:hypothetical protein
MFDAIHGQIMTIAAIVKEQGTDQARRSLDNIVVNEDLQGVILRLHTDVGVYQANKVLREINASARVIQEAKGGGFGHNEEWINAIIAALRVEMISKASGITETTKKYIVDILEEGQREGWSIEKIVSQLESPELTLWRARLIVRTELVQAYFKGHQLGAEKSKWETEDTWVSNRDHRRRHSHGVVDGDVITTGGRFKVPVYKTVGGGKGKKGIQMQTGFDLMEGPGDPRASIGNIANCRCTKTTRAKRDEKGDLIPKVKTMSIQ